MFGGIEHGLAFELYNKGYDVYMANGRGNSYSRKHKTLDPDSPEFWHWSFDEIAKYDFPAQIQKVLDISGKSKIWYLGYSEGAMVAQLALSEDKSGMSDSLYGIIGLGPVLTFNNARGPWKTFG